MMLRFMMCAVFFMLSLSASAYDFGSGDIKVPEGFEGPVMKAPSEAFSAVGFTRRHDDSDKSTLLQLTVFTPPNGIPELNQARKIAFSKQYLMQFLEGVKRRRDNFSTSAIETVSIDGQPAVRIRWTGRSTDNEVELYGEMYCVIYQQQLLSFHVQDFTDFDTSGYEAARSAVMAIAFD